MAVSSSAADAVTVGERGIDRNDVVSINGSYNKGDVIHVYDETGAERARGMTDFSSDETDILVRNIEMPVKQLLGYHSHAVLIEVENLVSLDDRHIPWKQELADNAS